MTDIYEISPSNAAGPVATSEARPASIGHLSCAVGPVHSTTDSEAESQRSRTLRRQVGQEHTLEEVILEVKDGTSA